MSKKYEKMTQEEFDEILADIIKSEGIQSLIMVPGVYELLAEYYNNDVLQIWLEEHPEDEFE